MLYSLISSPLLSMKSVQELTVSFSLLGSLSLGTTLSKAIILVRKPFPYLFFLLILQMVIKIYVVAVGKGIVDLCLDGVIELAGNDSHLQVFFGFWFRISVFERLFVDYGHKSKLGTTYYPLVLFERETHY